MNTYYSTALANKEAELRRALGVLQAKAKDPATLGISIAIFVYALAMDSCTRSLR